MATSDCELQLSRTRHTQDGPEADVATDLVVHHLLIRLYHFPMCRASYTDIIGSTQQLIETQLHL